MTKLFVKNQYLEFIEKELTTTDSENYYQIQFEFDKGWSDFVKHASFFNTTKGPRYVVQIPATNQIYIPNEVLKAKLPIYIGLYGVDANNVKLTTNVLQIPITIGAYTDTPTIVDDDFTKPLDFVKTQDIRIRFIREQDGVFQYSLDGIKWTEVRGKAGLGLPSGGNIGEYLVKSSINDYETEWKTFDNVVNAESINGVNSQAVISYIDNVLDVLPITDEQIKNLFNN